MFSIYEQIRHNVVYVFSIFYDDVITLDLGLIPNGYDDFIHRMSTALKQSKLLNYFQ